MLDPPQQMVRPGDSPLIICTMISGDRPAEIEWIKVCSNRNLRNIILLLIDFCYILRSYSYLICDEYNFKATGRLPSSVVTQDGRLQFNSISENDAGTYVCRARNNAGDSEARAEVIVNGKTIGKIITSLNLMMYSQKKNQP